VNAKGRRHSDRVLRVARPWRAKGSVLAGLGRRRRLRRLCRRPFFDRSRDAGRVDDRVAAGPEAPHTTLLDQPRQRCRRPPVEIPLAFATAAGPLPGAAPSASSTLACVCPRGAAFRREPAPRRARDGPRRARLAGAGPAPRFPSAPAGAARSAAAGAMRERSTGTERAPERAIASAARSSRSNSGTTGRSSRMRSMSSFADAIEQIRHRQAAA
jgi:hypothetical protein